MDIDVIAGVKFLDWLSSKGIRGCPMCGNKHMDVSAFVTVAVIDPRTEVTIPGHVPMAQVTCPNCRFVAHFSINTKELGLLPPLPEKVEPPQN